MKHITKNEGNDAGEYSAHGNVRHALYDIEVEADGGRDEAHFRDADNQNAEPDGINAHALYQRIEDRHGEKNDGHGIHEAAEKHHDEQNEDQDQHGAAHNAGDGVRKR